MQRELDVKKKRPQFLGIVGGSGAGKTWLADQLKQAIGKEAAILSLDHFYKDRSHLSPARRKSINFDNPRAIDWKTLQTVLLKYQRGESVSLPRYDFATHTVLDKRTVLPPKRVVIIEGLWLFRPVWLRKLFSLRVFVNCPEATRRARRLKRDLQQRGRTRHSVCNQFDACVSPMHTRYVEPQKRVADIILDSPINLNQLNKLVTEVKTRLLPSYARRSNSTH
ncbi:MAG: uridine kinase [Verrucomicrobiales bacterium]|nr:uridine kinase [Verrucomicrobiales bacterium]